VTDWNKRAREVMRQIAPEVGPHSCRDGCPRCAAHAERTAVIAAVLAAAYAEGQRDFREQAVRECWKVRDLHAVCPGQDALAGARQCIQAIAALPVEGEEGT
jgi:hypothetical protein